ncbi:MAG: CTP synthase [Defluviitaleaceae bacterium]|nr:CTP synthase [Defluviitaleaceae bacterium]
MKYIFITGGVVSGIGKGITAASLGMLLKQRDFAVSIKKLDPYMNVDPGTMSPFQHGEVFVTDDGGETDLDLGHYERFIDESLTKQANLTAGQVYQNVLEKERSGGYGGRTVQVIPHVTAEIKDFICDGTSCDIMIVEIGGTVGDIECQPFLEAIRQISLAHGRHNCLFLHVTLVPYIGSSKEHKSKPTQHSVRGLMAMGITPDIIITRADMPLSNDIKGKIALFCNVKPDCVIENITAASIYEVPLILNQNGLDAVVTRELKMDAPPPVLAPLHTLVEKINTRQGLVTIAIVGKYVQLPDAYLSVVESLNHAGFETGMKVNIRWIDSECFSESELEGVQGMVIPGGFGERGIEGMVRACNFARTNNIPLLGICLGMQIMSIEYARYMCGLEGANSTEFDENTPHPVIHIMEGQEGRVGSGGTMRLGAYPCTLAEGSQIRALYGTHSISERHRHRFEFNNAYRTALTEKGLTLSGTSPDNALIEAIELQTNDFHIGVQFHPEFLSRPNRAHPLFLGLLKGARK